MTGDERTERPLTGPFWAAVNRHELVRPVCGACGVSFFVPQFACPRCQSTRWTFEPSSGRGRVHSHTTVYRPPTPEFVGPYVLADVDVEEGWHLLTWIVDCEPDEVYIDMAVAVRFVPGPDGRDLPAFAPAAPESGMPAEGTAR
ncbi:Zn-ribbon domain-containing OB-fold protein [Candidatus Poriferisocius sp.]|uniref:Zn-ribbon domain-containing OB-fold protein n=1 Tax=Candidatus Poriferisocius sp. TaxID=3101276 RepID=UPI003B5C3A08